VPVFLEELHARLAQGAARTKSAAERRTVLVLPDQLCVEIGALKGASPRETTIILVESGEWLTRRPYHRQRLGWILLSQRTFALEAAESGFHVEVLRGDAPISAQLAAHTAESMTAMEPAEREMRVELAPLVAAGRLSFVPHDGFLTTAADLGRELGLAGAGARLAGLLSADDRGGAAGARHHGLPAAQAAAGGDAAA
jgi:hypothetical protein